MGINLAGFEALLKLYESDGELGDVLSLGHLRFSAINAPAKIKEVISHYPSSNLRQETLRSKFIDNLLLDLGAKKNHKLEYTKDMGDDVITFDLNEGAPSEMHGEYDTIIDGGLLEHVYNIPVAFENIMNLLRVGGVFVMETMANNHLGHGFWQFSPEVMYRVFSKKNGFDVCFAYLYDDGGLREALDPNKVGLRLEIGKTEKPTKLIFCAKKIEQVCPYENGWPLQSDYQSLWEEYVVSNAIKSKLFDEALSRARGFLEKNPDNPNTYLNLAKALVSKGELEEAFDYVRRAYEINPLHPEVVFQLGYIADRRKKYDLAIEKYLEAAELNPQMGRAFMAVSSIYRKNGDLSNAIKYGDMAVKARPKKKDYLEYVARLKERVEVEEKLDITLSSKKESVKAERKRRDFSEVNMNLFSRWITGDFCALNRIKERVIVPFCKPSFKANKDTTVFAIGSCFARNVEERLSQRGVKVTSMDVSGISSFHTEAGRLAGLLNKYTPASMLQELEWASGEKDYSDKNFIEIKDGVFYDPHVRNKAPHCSFDEVKLRRKEITQYFKRALSSDIVVMTLGLIEGWRDNETGLVLNEPPVGSYFVRNKKRFSLHRITPSECSEILEKIQSIFEKHGKKGQKIILTVSPVPLGRTFSGEDVIVANMLSKSTLLVAARHFAEKYDNVDYYPSYEAAMLSEPQIAWQNDRLHVSDFMVGHIIETFMQRYGVISDEDNDVQDSMPGSDDQELSLMRAMRKDIEKYKGLNIKLENEIQELKKQLKKKQAA